MRSLMVVALTLLMASAAAEVTTRGDTTGDAWSANVEVTDAGVRQTHQNMAFTLASDDRIWFMTETMHEHDGILTFQVDRGLGSKVTVVNDGTTQDTDIPTGSIGLSHSYSLSKTDDEFFFGTDDDGATEWTLRGAEGVWIRTWIHPAADPSLSTSDGDAHTVHVASAYLGEQVTATVANIQASEPSFTSGSTNEPLPVPRALGGTDAWLPCGIDDLRLDPEEPLTGNPVRVTVGDLAATGPVQYRLVSDDTTAGDAGTTLAELHHLAWRSDAVAGASSFRAPHEGPFRLQVEAGDLRCEHAFNVGAGSSETAEVVWSFTEQNGTLRFEANVDGNGHYEYPMSLVYVDTVLADDDEVGDAGIVFNGKLHSHGSPVSFTVPDARPGYYAVQFDVEAQSPDPIVTPDRTTLGAGQTQLDMWKPWQGTVLVAGADAGPVDDDMQESPAVGPFAVLALLGLALLKRRR